MLIDTHCHLNMMVKESFDTPLLPHQVDQTQEIIARAEKSGVTTIINVGTSRVESLNCMQLAARYSQIYATVGIHPNDLTPSWKDDLAELASFLSEKERHKIVGIGECGFDKHYPNPDMTRQKSALDAQINLALEYDLALVVHTRDAADETLRTLEAYKNDVKRGIIHCFSEDLSFAKTVVSWGYAIGLGGTITYPKNNELRKVAQEIPLEHIVLETDAPFLPPQDKRGQKNFPAYIADTARFLAGLRGVSVDEVGAKTSANARRIFNI